MEGPQPALPRAVDVQRFAGAREQELRGLVSTLKASAQLGGTKFGAGALPRHLRRRTASHNPYSHVKRPNSKLLPKRQKLQHTAAEAVSPATGAAGEGPAGGESGRVESDAEEPQPPPTNRRMRRRAALLRQQHQQDAAWSEAALAAAGLANAAASGGASVNSSNSGARRRLETHVWHAKRLALVQRWGWVLPLGAPGKGLGSRSFLHTLRTRAAMHDASYWCPLLLAGSTHSVQSVLSRVLTPADAAAVAAGMGGVGGGWELQVTLQHPEQQQHSQPGRAIGPAQVLLLPAASSSGPQKQQQPGSAAADVTAEQQPSAMEIDAPKGSAAANVPAGAPCSSPSGSASEDAVQMLVWVHAAAAGEAFNALAAAAAHAGALQAQLKVLDLRRIEFRGASADAALAAVLSGATGTASSSAHGNSSSSGTGGIQCNGSSSAGPQGGAPAAVAPAAALLLPEVLAALRDGEALQLLLPDPRLLKPVAVGSAVGRLLPAEHAQRAASPAEAAPLSILNVSALAPPLSEAALSSRRQQLRRQLLGMDASPPARPLPGQQQQQRPAGGGRQQAAGTHCPAVLVRHLPAAANGVPGWSLILPPGWVHPFWLAAAFAGCRPAGQREWRWLHTLQHCAFFPWDWPDTAAYAALMQQLQQEQRVEAARRPKGRFTPATPFPPPWQQLSTSAAGTPPPMPSHEQQQQPLPGEPAGAEQAQLAMLVEVQPGAAEAAPAAATAAAATLPAAAAMPETLPELPPPAAAADEAASAAAEAAPAAAAAPDILAAAAAAALSAQLPATGATAAATPPGAQNHPLGGMQLDVERSGAWSSGSGSAAPGALVARPVSQASRAGTLRWQPKALQQHPAPGATDASPSRNSYGGGGNSNPAVRLVEVSVHPIKRGAAAEGAAICCLLGREAERHTQSLQIAPAAGTRRRRSNDSGSDSGSDSQGEGAAAAQPPNGGSGAPVAAEQVYVIGYVCSAAPRGVPQSCGSLALVSSTAAWRLRSLQYHPQRRDRGTLEAFLRNPNSSALHPVRLSVLQQ